MQNLVGLLSDMDKGEIGDNSRDDFAAVLRKLESNVGDLKYKDGIPKKSLVDMLKGVKPFKDTRYRSVNAAISETLDAMEKDGLIVVKRQDTGGRPALLINLGPGYINSRQETAR